MTANQPLVIAPILLITAAAATAATAADGNDAVLVCCCHWYCCWMLCMHHAVPVSVADLSFCPVKHFLSLVTQECKLEALHLNYSENNEQYSREGICIAADYGGF